MTAEELPSATATSKPLDAELRKDLLKSLVLALPMLLIGMSVGWLKDKTITQPGQAIWVVIPGMVLLGLIFLRTTTRQKLKLGWPFLVFLPVYILIFFIAAESGLLDWKRSLVGYEKSAPRNFLAVNRFGDWHYRFAAEEMNSDLAVVLMKHPETIEESRRQIADLIDLASQSEAKGVALDFYFVDEANVADEFLCSTITDAKTDSGKRPMPVFVGYDYEIGEDGLNRLRGDPFLEKCLPESSRGHAIGYAEWDGRVRSIPLYFGNNRKYEALSLKVASEIAGDNSAVKVPDNGLLQFIKPANDFKPIAFDKLWKDYLSEDSTEWERDQSKLRDKFMLVGEDSEKDSFLTPYGMKPGVVIHAYAVHSLRQNHFIKRGAWWVSLIMISLLSYLMMVLTSRGVGNLKLILINMGFSLLIVAISVLSMYLWLTWIDLVYPLLATWLFLVLLILLRIIGARKTKAAIG